MWLVGKNSLTLWNKMGAWECRLNLGKLMLWTNRRTVWAVVDYMCMQGCGVGKKVKRVLTNINASNTKVFCKY